METCDLLIDIDRTVEIEVDMYEAAKIYVEQALKHNDHADLCHHLCTSNENFRLISSYSNMPEDSWEYKEFKRVITERILQFDNPFYDSIKEIADDIEIARFRQRQLERAGR